MAVVWLWLVALVSLSTQIKPPKIKISPIHNPSPYWKTTFSLECLTEGWPGSPSYFWIRGSYTLYPYSDPKIIFSPNKQVITFTEATRKQNGTFYCFAAEHREYLFEVSDTVQIAVLEPPYIPTNITASHKTPYSLHLSWTQEGDIPPQYFKVHHAPQELHYTMQEPRGVITGLRPYTVYTFTVQAVNEAGVRGSSEPLQTRTDSAEPDGLLRFSIGVRTGASLQVKWERPGQGVVNDELTGYSIIVHSTSDNLLVHQSNFTPDVLEFTLAELTPQTGYTVSMNFITRCCASNYESKETHTMVEGETAAPTVQPRTEGNTESQHISNSLVIGVSVGCVLLLLLLLLLLIFYRYRGGGPGRGWWGGGPGRGWSGGGPGRGWFSSVSKPATPWNDGTESGDRDLLPVSPPPDYEPGNVASRSFTYNRGNRGNRNQGGGSGPRPPTSQPIINYTTSPPPAYNYQCRSLTDNDRSDMSSSASSAMLHGSISELSNVDSVEEKEQNIPVTMATPPLFTVEEREQNIPVTMATPPLFTVEEREQNIPVTMATHVPVLPPLFTVEEKEQNIPVTPSLTTPPPLFTPRQPNTPLRVPSPHDLNQGTPI